MRAQLDFSHCEGYIKDNVTGIQTTFSASSSNTSAYYSVRAGRSYTLTITGYKEYNPFPGVGSVSLKLDYLNFNFN